PFYFESALLPYRVRILSSISCVLLAGAFRSQRRVLASNFCDSTELDSSSQSPSNVSSIRTGTSRSRALTISRRYPVVSFQPSTSPLGPKRKSERFVDIFFFS